MITEKQRQDVIKIRNEKIEQIGHLFDEIKELENALYCIACNDERDIHCDDHHGDCRCFDYEG